MRIELNDKVALVTGSARRIGRAIALELAKQGVTYTLCITIGSDPAQVRYTLQEIKSLGVDGICCWRGSQPKPEGVQQLFQRVSKTYYDRLDIVVNNAAVFQQRNFLDVSLEDWDLTMALNLRAPFLDYPARGPSSCKRHPAPGGTDHQHMRCRRRRALDQVPSPWYQQIRLCGC